MVLTILPLEYASAQASDSIPMFGKLGKVVVTAQKKATNVQNVPASVSFITEQKSVRQRIWNVRDLSGLFPNLYMSNPGDGRNVIGIRGIVTTSYKPAVAVYVDGVLQYNLDTYTNGLLDIKRIEILRGPQGTLYGRNAMGGVINIITKEPGNKTSAFAGVDVGNYGVRRYKIRFNKPIIANKLFLGVSGMYKRSNGFYENKYTNSHFDKQHETLGNFYLKYLPGSHWDITLNYKFSLARNRGAFPLAGSITKARENPFQLNQNSIGKMVDNNSNASLSIVHKGDQIHFTSHTAYQSNYRVYEEPVDGDFSPLDIVSIVNNYGKPWNKVKVWTEELRLSSSENNNHRISWMAGMFSFINHSPVKQGSHFGKKAGVYGAQPNTTLLTINKGEDKGIAIFAQGNVSITPKLDFTLGLRYDWEHRQISGSSKLLIPGRDPAFIYSDTTGEGSYDALSPEAILSYNLSSNNMIFLSYKRGFRAGGISEVSQSPSSPPLRTFGPEFSNNFELGVKNEFLNKRVRWNISLFYTRVNHIQVSQLILPEALTVTKNAGKMRSFGLESEFTALMGHHFSLTWNTGYTNAEFVKLIKAGNKANKDLSGNKQIFTPNFTSNFRAHYGKLLGKSKAFKFQASAAWQWIGTTYFNLTNTLKQEPYHLINARASIQKGHFGLTFWAKNIFNTQYVDYAYSFGAAHLGAPGTFGVSVRYKL